MRPRALWKENERQDPMTVEARPFPRSAPAVQAAMGCVEMGTGYADRIYNYQYSRQHREWEVRDTRVRVRNQGGASGLLALRDFFLWRRVEGVMQGRLIPP